MDVFRNESKLMSSKLLCRPVVDGVVPPPTPPPGVAIPKLQKKKMFENVKTIASPSFHSQKLFIGFLLAYVLGGSLILLFYLNI